MIDNSIIIEEAEYEKCVRNHINSLWSSAIHNDLASVCTTYNYYIIRDENIHGDESVESDSGELYGYITRHYVNSRQEAINLIGSSSEEACNKKLRLALSLGYLSDDLYISKYIDELLDDKNSRSLKVLIQIFRDAISKDEEGQLSTEQIENILNTDKFVNYGVHISDGSTIHYDSGIRVHYLEKYHANTYISKDTAMVINFITDMWDTVKPEVLANEFTISNYVYKFRCCDYAVYISDSLNHIIIAHNKDIVYAINTNSRICKRISSYREVCKHQKLFYNRYISLSKYLIKGDCFSIGLMTNVFTWESLVKGVSMCSDDLDVCGHAVIGGQYVSSGLASLLFHNFENTFIMIGRDVYNDSSEDLHILDGIYYMADLISHTILRVHLYTHYLGIKLIILDKFSLSEIDNHMKNGRTVINKLVSNGGD